MFSHTIEEYVEQHSSPENEALKEITRTTNQLTVHPHMLSGQVQGRLLAMLSHMITPKRILEIGTFTAYSALCLAEGLTPNGVLHTIEINDELEDLIKHNLSLSPLGKKIQLHIGDAIEVISTFKNLPANEKFDMVFIDADKREYVEYYEAVFPLVRRKGYILADNTLWDGHIIDDKYAKDKQTIGLRKFNDFVLADRRVEKVLLPIRDGLTIIRKL